jgi:hypothetical protein
MLVFTSFIQGVKNVWANKFLIGIMFLYKFLFSLILLAPLYLMFSASFGANARASSLLQKLDSSLLIDFVYHWRQTLSIYFLMSFLVFFLAVVVFIFLSGGFWGILRDGSKGEEANSKIERFFGYCAKYFWGMFKIALLLMLFYLIAFFLFLFFAAILDSVAGESGWLEITSWRVATKMAAFAFLFLLVNMIGDYLRIFYVQNFLERLLGSVKRAFRFLLTNLLKTLSLYYLLSVFLVVAILAFVGLNKLTEGIPKTSFYVLLIFLLQQLLSLFRAFYRLIYYSSQLVLTHKLSIEKETSK